jgi:hypothetical protein
MTGISISIRLKISIISVENVSEYAPLFAKIRNRRTTVNLIFEARLDHDLFIVRNKKQAINQKK